MAGPEDRSRPGGSGGGALVRRRRFGRAGWRAVHRRRRGRVAAGGGLQGLGWLGGHGGGRRGSVAGGGGLDMGRPAAQCVARSNRRHVRRPAPGNAHGLRDPLRLRVPGRGGGGGSRSKMHPSAPRAAGRSEAHDQREHGACSYDQDQRHGNSPAGSPSGVADAVDAARARNRPRLAGAARVAFCVRVASSVRVAFCVRVASRVLVGVAGRPLDYVLQCRRVLAPEVGGAWRRRRGGSLVRPCRSGSERHQFFTRTEPITGQSHHVVRRLRLPRADLGLRPFWIQCLADLPRQLVR